jgi:mono/diheme cytochrome c family protein
MSRDKSLPAFTIYQIKRLYMKRIATVFLSVFLASPLLAQVDYNTEIQPIFNASCTSCHGNNGGVSLTSYAALMGSVGNNYGSNLVVAGNPDASGLVDKIEPDPQHGNRMPVGGQLSSDQINLIRQWITEGAAEQATSNELGDDLPQQFKLLGNYPNPFNPSTQIRFESPQSTQYTLAVYTVHGMLIREMVGTANAGEVRVSVDMGSNPSGVYLYKISALLNGRSVPVGSGQMTLIK